MLKVFAGGRAGRRMGARCVGFISLVWLGLSGWLPWAHAFPPGGAAPAGFRADRVIIRAAANANPGAVQRLHARLGSAVTRSFAHGRGAQVVKLRPGTSVAEALAAFRQSGLVEFAEPDYLLKPLVSPNDFFYADQPNLHNTGIYGGTAGADIMAEAGWDLQRDASDIIVAVIDTGVRYTHQDIAGNMWVNPGESGTDGLGRDKRSNGVDDDGNGFVDDVHGINVLNDSGNPWDEWGHGTHVAGIVGAVSDNAIGIAGVAWRVKIMACRFIENTGHASISDAITCLDYARMKGAKIVTASWGSYSFTSVALRDAIATLRDAGIIVTAAAGNDNNNNDTMPLYPASYDLDNIIVAAATDRTDAAAFFTNYGVNSVDVGAPGAPVFSLWAGSDTDYRYNDGTSMAAPHLAGACALLWTRFPGDTHQQILQRILSTVDPLPGLAGRTKTGGRLNLGAALASGTTPPPTPLPPPSALSASASSSTTVNLTWTDNSAAETGFEIQRSTDNVTFASVGSAGANVTSTSSGGLSASTTYYFRVRALQGSTTSAFSNTASVTTPAPPPAAVNPPSGLVATAISATQINLSWVDNSNNETGFQLERSTDNTSFALIATAAANATQYSDPGRSTATTYYYRVRAAGSGAFSAYTTTASATTTSPPPSGGWLRADIGNVGVAGSDEANGNTITVRGSGSDVWDTADAFRFVGREMNGDGTVEAQVSSLGNTHGWAKGGVMIRESLAPNARNVFAYLTPSNGVAAQARTATGGGTVFNGGSWWVSAPHWVRLVRTGNQIVAYESANGATWTQIASYTVAMNATVYAGFALTSHDNAQLGTAVFTDPLVQ